MKKMLIDYIREESQCNYYDLADYFKDINQCGHELKAKYLGDLIVFIACKEIEEGKKVERKGGLKMTENELKEIQKEIDKLPRSWFFHDMAVAMVNEIKDLKQQLEEK